MEWIQSTTGRCRPDELGMTLVHEHLLIGFPGWQMDALAPRYVRAEEAGVRVESSEMDCSGSTGEKKRTHGPRPPSLRNTVLPRKTDLRFFKG